jgi:hypothetical protein
MIAIHTVLIGIIIVFAVFLALRSIFSFKVCALCASAFSVWVVLLFLFYSGNLVDPILIGILMGGSVVGMMYMLEQKLSEKYQIFKLPFFLTFVSAAYFVLERSVSYSAVLILLLLWVLLSGLYAARNTAELTTLGKKIIECCKNW